MADSAEPPTKPHPYADDVADAIAGHNADHPVELWHLHEAIDARERDAIVAEELNAILGWLAASGRVRELPLHRYVDATHASGSADLTPVTADEWTAARAEYSRWFARTFAELQDRWSRPGGAVVPVITVSVPIARRRPSKAEEGAAGALADAVVDALVERGFVAFEAIATIAGRSLVSEIIGIPGQDSDGMLAIATGIVTTMGPQGSTASLEMQDLSGGLPPPGALVPIIRVTPAQGPMPDAEAAVLIESVRGALQAAGIETGPFGADGTFLFAGGEGEDGEAMLRLTRAALKGIGASDAEVVLEEHDHRWLLGQL
jgi:hypothetical protein